MKTKSLYKSSWIEDQTFFHEYNGNYKRIVISDCDGILTNGNLSYTENGKFMKTYGCHDKEMVRLLQILGWEFIFVSNDITGFGITKSRIKQSFGLDCIQADSVQRTNLVEEYKKKGYDVVFCGDSPSDVAAAEQATLSCTTKNCFTPIKPYFNYISEHNGGEGGFAEILYYVMETFNCK